MRNTSYRSLTQVLVLRDIRHLYSDKILGLKGLHSKVVYLQAGLSDADAESSVAIVAQQPLIMAQLSSQLSCFVLQQMVVIYKGQIFVGGGKPFLTDPFMSVPVKQINCYLL